MQGAAWDSARYVSRDAQSRLGGQRWPIPYTVILLFGTGFSLSGLWKDPNCALLLLCHIICSSEIPIIPLQHSKATGDWDIPSMTVSWRYCANLYASGVACPDRVVSFLVMHEATSAVSLIWWQQSLQIENRTRADNMETNHVSNKVLTCGCAWFRGRVAK